MDFKNKIVVITGGAKGIGKCMVEEFRGAGAQVAVIDKDTNAVECDLYHIGDIAIESTLQDFVERVITRYEKIDFLINNAYSSHRGILTGCSFEEFNYVLKVGVTAPYYLTKLLMPHFSSSAAIVNISSTRAFMSQPNTESYTAAKGGITALTHALAVSLKGKVRVNSISPGWIDNIGEDWSCEDKMQHPAGRVGNPKDIAKLAMFLCSDDSGFITGENIIVDGGMTKQMIYHNDHGWEFKVT